MTGYKLVLPPMGEGTMEATVTGWIKNEGDFVNEDEAIVKVATDKVDSDVPSPVSGRLVKKLKTVNEICKIGEVFAILEIEKEEDTVSHSPEEIIPEEDNNITDPETLTELEQPLWNGSSDKEG
ncbi:MAG: 2-oxo acid dehydrogenase subunit E2, partial [Flavobacteriaceae bacterium]|nr:2-oxo acid dehydrogenase subunit E2 [Flavobacteriaceae bacterium]